MKINPSNPRSFSAVSSAVSGDIPELQLRQAASLYQTENIAISLTVLILYSKVFKYFELSAGLSEFSRTMEGAAPHLLRFMIVVVISLSGFSLSGYFVFGTQSAEYSSLGLSLVSLIRGLFGDMNPQNFYKTNRVTGPLFFLLYQLFAQFIFLEHFMTYVAGTALQAASKIAAPNSCFRVVFRAKKLQVHKRIDY